MERIASFCVDHTRLMPGMYLSRRDGADGEILTWDIRMKRPNQGQYLSPAAAHTIEHLFATFARNSKYGKHVVYVGPMGCLTGFYLLTTGLTDAEALDLVRSAFAWMAAYDGEIPGASAVECGNYRMMDPAAARAEAAAMLPVLNALAPDHLRYLLVCSAGMSTSLLVTKMEAAAKDAGVECKIFALPFSDAPRVLEEVDCILLGPQVRFQKAAIEKLAAGRKAGPIPVDVIDMRDYGTMNGKAVFEKALSLLK